MDMTTRALIHARSLFVMPAYSWCWVLCYESLPSVTTGMGESLSLRKNSKNRIRTLSSEKW